MKSDLVFREETPGRLVLVGDFEGVYAAEPDPWQQSAETGPMAAYYAEARARLAQAVWRHAPDAGHSLGLEIGCGHGHVLPVLANAAGGEWHGLDISAAAVEQARKNYPKHRFHHADITRPIDVQRASYDVTILSQVLWYILEHLDTAVANCRRLTRPGGAVMVSQAFLKGEQRYGKDIADGFGGALRLFLERYPALRLIEARYDDTGRHVHNDGLLVFRRVE